jgi:hypothetical protein
VVSLYYSYILECQAYNTDSYPLYTSEIMSLFVSHAPSESRLFEYTRCTVAFVGLAPRLDLQYLLADELAGYL